MTDVLPAVAPLIALLGALAAVVSATSRHRLSNKLRDDIERDAAILPTVPEGPARDSVLQLLEFESERLRRRVAEGREVRVYSVLAVYGLVVLIPGAIMRLIVEFDDELPGRESPGWLMFFGEWTSKISLILGVALVLVATLLATIYGVVSVKSRVKDGHDQWAAIRREVFSSFTTVPRSPGPAPSASAATSQDSSQAPGAPPRAAPAAPEPAPASRPALGGSDPSATG